MIKIETQGKVTDKDLANWFTICMLVASSKEQGSLDSFQNLFDQPASYNLK